jgi:prepilin-type N-terminal cleavage/methylation domain-containing protein
MRKLIVNLKEHSASSGFTLIELMIVLAVIAVIIMMALPVYSNYTIRTKIGESLSVAASAKTSLASTCVEDPTLTNLTNLSAGYDFEETKYVLSVVVSGDCVTPIITLTTQATGAQPDPVLTITGNFTVGTAVIDWTCVSTGLNIHVPKTCRS